MHKNIGNLNNEIRLPITLLLKPIMTFPYWKWACPLMEILNLVNVVYPDIAVITNIGVLILNILVVKKIL